jgi:hypothetical protein
MEMYGLGFLFLWMIVASGTIIWRMAVCKYDGCSTSFLKLYLGLSVVLGLQLVGYATNGLHLTNLHYSEGFETSICLWSFIWSPISLTVVLLSPRRLLHLPITFILCSAMFGACTGLLIDDGQAPPVWEYLGFAAIGLMLVIGGIITGWRIAGKSPVGLPVSSPP